MPFFRFHPPEGINLPQASARKVKSFFFLSSSLLPSAKHFLLSFSACFGRCPFSFLKKTPPGELPLPATACSSPFSLFSPSLPFVLPKVDTLLRQFLFYFPISVFKPSNESECSSPTRVIPSKRPSPHNLPFAIPAVDDLRSRAARPVLLGDHATFPLPMTDRRHSATLFALSCSGPSRKVRSLRTRAAVFPSAASTVKFSDPRAEPHPVPITSLFFQPLSIWPKRRPPFCFMELLLGYQSLSTTLSEYLRR